MAFKRKYANIVTPFGTAVYPKISAPDTKGEFADGKYKTDLELSAEDLKEFQALVKEKLKTLYPEGAPKTIRLPFAKDKKTGAIYVRTTSDHKPLITDTKKQALPDDLWISGGSEIRLAGVLATYEKGPNKGVSFWIDAVQVKKLVSGGGKGVDAFDTVEGGFEFDAASYAPRAAKPSQETPSEADAGDPFDL